MGKKRVTDIENCRRITVPDAAEASKESKIQVLIDNLDRRMLLRKLDEKNNPS